MSKKKFVLGRGLDQMLSTPFIENSEPKSANNEYRYLPIEFLQRGKYQPRRDIKMEALQELADSIREQGIIQPVVVRNIEKDRYEIIAGERRWRAAQLIGLQEVPVIIRNISDADTIAIALIENIQRENLNPMEEAIALERLIQEFSMTHEQVAKAVGKSRTTVSNFLRLLNLNDDVKSMIEERTLEMGHAKVLLTLRDKNQSEAAKIVVSKNLSVRETEQLIKQYGISEKKKVTKSADPDVVRLQNKLSDTLGAKILIHHSIKGYGKLIIHYNNLDELDGILEHIQ